jgi:hypothetical protein
VIDPTGPASTGAATAAATAAPPVIAAEPRQRWRLTFARDPVATDAVGRAGLDAWQASLVESGLPLAGLEAGGVGRARVAIGAPLPATAAGEAELVEVWLLERLPLWAVREALAARLPAAHRWIDAEDVWLGAPALAGRVVAADWRIEVGAGPSGGHERLAVAGRALLAAPSLMRTRVKGTTEKRYDLRPLVADLTLDAGDPARPGGLDRAVIRLRTRMDPERGSGRPEEVVAALAEAAGCPLEIGAITRERLLLAGDRAAGPAGATRRA